MILCQTSICYNFLMPTKRQLISIYRSLFPNMRIRVARKRTIRKKRTAGATLHYHKHRESARTLVHKRLAELNRHYNFTYHRVAIRDQKSRWGSCSKKGNLNFNYRLMFLPEPLIDAVIVHELCHLEEFNHGKKFWELVARTIPDHKERRAQLARLPIHLLGRNQVSG